MKYDIITMNLIDMVNNIKEIIKNLSLDTNNVDIETYSNNILTLMDTLESVKIIQNQLINEDN